jgi:hypothetical protein
MAQTLISLGNMLLAALASFNWTTILPGAFAGIATSVVNLLNEVLAWVSAKFAPAPAAPAA